MNKQETMAAYLEHLKQQNKDVMRKSIELFDRIASIIEETEKDIKENGCLKPTHYSFVEDGVLHKIKVSKFNGEWRILCFNRATGRYLPLSDSRIESRIATLPHLPQIQRLVYEGNKEALTHYTTTLKDRLQQTSFKEALTPKDSSE